MEDHPVSVRISYLFSNTNDDTFATKVAEAKSKTLAGLERVCEDYLALLDFRKQTPIRAAGRKPPVEHTRNNNQNHQGQNQNKGIIPAPTIKREPQIGRASCRERVYVLV